MYYLLALLLIILIIVVILSIVNYNYSHNENCIHWETAVTKTEAQVPLYEQQIPFIIHQTFVYDKLPSKLNDCMKSWIVNNPEYEHHYYTNSECEQIIRANFDPDVYQAYKILIPGSAKANLFRYCILYLFGGVYININCSAKHSLSSIINPDDTCIIMKNYNGFIAITPHHELMRKAIELTVSNVHNGVENTVKNISGCGVIDSLYHDNHPRFRCDYKYGYYNDTPFMQIGYRCYERDRKSCAGSKHKHLYKICAPSNISNKHIISKIPNLVVQTWKDNYVTPGMFAAQQTWISNNPKFNYMFFSDEDSIPDIRNYSEDALTAYNTLRPGAFKADLWRIISLYKRGGVYADSDMICKSSLLNILRDYDLVLCRDTSNVTFYNAFIGCRKKMDLMRDVVEHIISNVLQKRYDIDLFAVTGPRAFTKVIYDYYPELFDAKTNYIQPGSYNIRNCKILILYHKGDETVRDARHNIILHTKYPGYDNEKVGSGSNNYGYMWKHRLVYTD